MLEIKLNFLITTLHSIFMPFSPCVEVVCVRNYIERIYRIISRENAELISGTVSLNCAGVFKMHFLHIK